MRGSLFRRRQSSNIRRNKKLSMSHRLRRRTVQGLSLTRSSSDGTIKPVSHDEDENQATLKRSTRGVLPKRYEDYEVDVANVMREEPTSYVEAVGGSEQDLWKATMRTEYDKLMKNWTWRLEKLPTGRVSISCK